MGHVNTLELGKRIGNLRDKVEDTIRGQIERSPKVQQHLVHASAHTLEALSDTRLDAYGLARFHHGVNRIANGDPIEISDYHDVLRAYPKFISGADNITGFQDQQVLIVANHSKKGPLRGFGNLMVINRVVKTHTGEEVRWIQKEGNMITFPVHKMIGESIGAITVPTDGRSTGTEDLRRPLREKTSIGIYPEGEINDKMQKADSRAGKLLLLALKMRNPIPVVCLSSWFEPDTSSPLYGFHLVIHQRLSLMEVKEAIATRSSLNGNAKHGEPQAAIDYAMHRIASFLPPDQQGYYGENNPLT